MESGVNPNIRREDDWGATELPSSGLATLALDLASPAPQRAFSSSEEVNAYYFHRAPQIEVDASPDQMRQLFARIQHQWKLVGAEEPYWSVLTKNEYKRSQFDEDRRAEFYETGQHHSSLIDILCKRSGTQLIHGLCVELGCGVGRVTKHLAGLFERVIAVDISEGNLAECDAMLKCHGITNVETKLLRSVTELEDLPQFDFLYSIIVLQHNPPPVQKYILDTLFKKIVRGGGFLVQAQTYHADYAFSVDSYLSAPVQESMEMHSFPMHHIMKLAADYRLSIREVLPDDCTGRFGSTTFFASGEVVPDAQFTLDHLGMKRMTGLNDSLRTDLKELAAHIQSGHISHRKEGALLSHDVRHIPAQSLWGKINSYLNSFKLLTKTRRSIEWMEQSVLEVGDAIRKTDTRMIALEEALQRSCEFMERLEGKIAATDSRQRDDATALGQRLERQAVDLQDHKDLLRFERATRQKSFSDFDRRLATYAFRHSSETALVNPERAEPQAIGLQSLLETFYFLLEERHRGARADIKQRLTVYRQDFEAARTRLKCSGPVIDIGCGRGEFLEVLSEDGFQVLGVDQNNLQLDAARRQGLPVLHEDAQTYLASLADDSVLAVSGIHIAEHIPFQALTALIQDIARVLKPGGLLLLETPNPRNLNVGANTFHLDPTHIKPLPMEVLQILFETCGFVNIDTRLLHPLNAIEDVAQDMQLDPAIAQLFFGPQDYAVLGIKG
jgi:O-antigen chain-terminating methyltransferase